MLIAGGVLTGLAPVATFGGFALMWPGYPPLRVASGMILLIAGGASFFAGPILLITGAVRHVRWKKYLRERTPSVSFAPTRHGWAGGVSFRF
jgi:hypothetical protein